MIRRFNPVCKASHFRYNRRVITIEGLSASRGIAIGPVFCLVEEGAPAIPRHSIPPEAVDGEWKRFEEALSRSRDEIVALKDGGPGEQAAIFDAHLMMLSDPEFIPAVRAALSRDLVNVEAVLADKVGEAAATLRATGDAYLAERAVDIEDAFGRVSAHLARLDSRAAARFVPPGSIVVARNIKPSEALSLKDSGLAGIALEEGGATSHVAILARSWGIPAVMGARGLLGAAGDGETVILDAHDGLVIVSPASDQLNHYRSRAQADRVLREEEVSRAALLAEEPATTACGTPLSFRANIALASEAGSARAAGARGVGLFRSEFLFLSSARLPDEDEQYAAYREAVEAADGDPVVIRTLDAGADKMLAEQGELRERNPLLGWRALRYCLDRRDLFKTQLRALARASAHGDLRVMFPMVSSVEELDAALDVLDEAREECARDGSRFNPEMKVGVMVEIPSAAVCADLLAKRADFLSIGTNDLIQYTMAVDRENAKVAHLFDQYSPAILRLVKRTIDAGRDAGIEVSLCGEMAGDPEATVLLLGLGLRSFSMDAGRLPSVREVAGRVTIVDAEALASAALSLSAAREVRKLVQERMRAYA